jgi:hypothetical protein
MHSRQFLATAVLAASSSASAQLTPGWMERVPLGTSLRAGMSGLVVDDAGVTYVTGTGGPSSNTDIVTAAIGADGALLWEATYDGPVSWIDQSRDICLAPGGVVYVTGSTPRPTFESQVVLLKYDAATGALLDSVLYASGPTGAESGLAVTADEHGNVFVGGSTSGDGGDALILSFDPEGALRWRQTWDGPASAPYSQDFAEQVLIGPDGDLIVRLQGVMSSLHPDYIVAKYDASDGTRSWLSTWGTIGEESSSDMEIDATGDVFVTGVALDNGVNKFGTVKFRGSDGEVQWAEYDSAGLDDGAFALALDAAGDVYVTGAVDPDGNNSNFNEDFYTVKRDGTTGGFNWSHRFGDPCVGCFDNPQDVIVDSAGNVMVVGNAASAPIGGMVLFILDAATGVETTRAVLRGQGESIGGNRLRLDALENIIIGARFRDSVTTSISMGAIRYGSMSGCYADCDGTGVLDVFDFLCFQDAFVSGDPYADCTGEGTLDVFDFLCFQDAFVTGCP